MEPTFNKLTGDYEVFCFGKTHKFSERLDAYDYYNEVMEWMFSDPFEGERERND